jgi:hypothetical protein
MKTILKKILQGLLEDPIEDVVLDEAYDEVLKDKVHETLDDDVVSFGPSRQNLHDDVGINEDHDVLSYLLDGDDVVHDDYWSSFGLPIYESSYVIYWVYMV